MPSRLTAREAAVVLFYGMRLAEKPGVDGGGVTRETVYWRFTRNGWVTVLWLTVTNYATGLLRLRNDVIASVPKNVWPFPLPARPSFELTFHWSEVTDAIGEPLFAYCTAGIEDNLLLGWSLFAEEETYPGYAWTKKARQFQASSQPHK